ncbi:MAG: D-alanyl-D-alanine carboxypeptidase/D-alanyl-D-alanine-endopeptidase [Microbacteriaceae bacterium]
MAEEITQPKPPRWKIPPFVIPTVAGITIFGMALATGYLIPTGAVPIPTPTADVRAVPENTPTASPVRTCSIAGAVADARLGTATVHIRNALTDEVLYSFGEEPAVPMASVMKIITAAVALTALGPDATLTTRVVKGSAVGSVVLIGGGDPTLTVGNGTVYDGAPSVRDLAQQTISALQAADPDDSVVTNVIVDLSYFPIDDAWHPSWPTRERTDGYQPLIVPLMIDGDRANPSRQTSPRSTDPARRAVDAFIAALRAEGNGDGEITITYGSAPGNATQLAAVSSQPVSRLVAQMLPVSDNTLGEFLLRASSVKAGLGGTARSLQQTVESNIARLGVDMSSGTFLDGSGESGNIQIPVGKLSDLLDYIFADASPLTSIAAALPVAGKSGTLASRFVAPNAAARGAVVAKTGWINGVYALAGRITSADGTPLIAIVVARGAVTSTAMPAIDGVFNAGYTCGNNLASY